MRKKTILVTGGTGYIGSHACVELLKNNYAVVIIDNLSNSDVETLTAIEQIGGHSVHFFCNDIRDQKALETIFGSYAIDAVIHFAGLKAVGESCIQPIDYYHNNFYGTLVLSQAMQAAGIKKLIFSSSATVYGESGRIPYRENAVICPTNPYGRTKAMIEQMLADLAAADEMTKAKKPWQIVLLRYFNPIGAHESGLMGESPQGTPNNLVPYIAQVAAGKLKQVAVFGNDYPTRDGTGIRDYIHVVDLAKGHLHALALLNQRLISKSVCKAYNLGTGKGYSVLEIIQGFEQVTGKKIPYSITTRRAGDIAESIADTELAQHELNWQAEKNLIDMITDTWRWQNHQQTKL